MKILSKALEAIERAGNRLPHPITLFLILSAVIVVISGICAALDVSASAALGKGEIITYRAVSLMTKEGLAYMLTHAVSNFTAFAPLGVVLVCMLGVGCAEGSGYISAFLVNVSNAVPKRLLCPAVVFLGVMSNVASDVGYVVLIPLGAVLFRAFGRHPVAGIAAAFAGVSGGFSANLVVGTLDPLLGGITTEAAAIIAPGYSVNATANWYFLAASTFLIVGVGAWVTERMIEPRLGACETDCDAPVMHLNGREKKALTWANLAALGYVALIIALCLPHGSFLRNPESGSLIDRSPLMGGIIVLIALFFFIPGAVYGSISGKYAGEKDLCKQMGSSMATLGDYIALAFFAAQFIHYFAYTGLGTILAINGAHLLERSGLPGPALMVLFILFTAFINLFMGSASAKWMILAPIFVPMFMLLGYSPELTQVAYRIGDSCTNIITPLMAYFVIIVVYIRKYDSKAGIGTLISTMLPYSLAFLIGWTILLVTWMLLKLPLGPGAPLVYGG